MNNIRDLQFHVGPFGDNRWLALTLCSPYVCFEAESKDALLERLRAALAFCRKIQAQIQIELVRRRETPTFHATQVISGRELEDA